MRYMKWVYVMYEVVKYQKQNGLGSHEVHCAVIRPSFCAVFYWGGWKSCVRKYRNRVGPTCLVAASGTISLVPWCCGRIWKVL